MPIKDKSLLHISAMHFMLVATLVTTVVFIAAFTIPSGNDQSSGIPPMFVKRSDPDLIWMVDENNRNIFHISIIYQQTSIFNLIREIGIFKHFVTTTFDNYGNNMLHLVGEMVPVNSVLEVALHMR